ncbi:hypothetical protein U9M48_034575, partial [Paspalum notatum var. saurae]
MTTLPSPYPLDWIGPSPFFPLHSFRSILFFHGPFFHRPPPLVPAPFPLSMSHRAELSGSARSRGPQGYRRERERERVIELHLRTENENFGRFFIKCPRCLGECTFYKWQKAYFKFLMERKVIVVVEHDGGGNGGGFADGQEYEAESHRVGAVSPHVVAAAAATAAVASLAAAAAALVLGVLGLAAAGASSHTSRLGMRRKQFETLIHNWPLVPISDVRIIVIN